MTHQNAERETYWRRGFWKASISERVRRWRKVTNASEWTNEGATLSRFRRSSTDPPRWTYPFWVFFFFRQIEEQQQDLTEEDEAQITVITEAVRVIGSLRIRIMYPIEPTEKKNSTEPKWTISYVKGYAKGPIQLFLFSAYRAQL